ncbi:MAG: carbohydrate kinase family protein [Dehalococcoidia bacterium]|nr:carbohydrate kinase family protein [Dehalococcoidia bacterium]
MDIFVSGSLAYDRIMDFPGKFSDHIMPEKIHILNVSFVVNGLVERLGGTAGNIAYALALLGERPTILATIGQDYQRYFQWFEKNHISHEGIRIIEDEFTSGAYITTDQSDNQITGFNPGAMKHPSLFRLDGVDPTTCFAIIAPGNLQDMMTYHDLYRTRNIPFIFDPGQSLPQWDPEKLAHCIEGAKVLIANDYEMEMIMARTGLDKAALLKRADAVITTKGDQGSVVATHDGEALVPAVKRIEGLVDPTGAGDAYRGGFIKGLVAGKDLIESAKIGTVCASFAIECPGTQTYSFTEGAFRARFRQHFEGRTGTRRG